MEVEFRMIGTGTSCGNPFLMCTCVSCVSKDPRDRRTRSSALLRVNGLDILIDCGPDFRKQALRHKIKKVDALFLTHPHADHVFGFEDLLPIHQGKVIPVYGNKFTFDQFQSFYSHLLDSEKYFKLILIKDTTPINFQGILITPIPVMHGKLSILGYRIGNTSYLTDVNKIPNSSYALLKNSEVLIIDGLELESHTTHFCFDEAFTEIIKISPSQAYIVHLSHEHTHTEVQDYFSMKLAKSANPTVKAITICFDGILIPGVRTE
jgi:phosphoribosyl 1,2-cyclic phosphate phosphodiesterase